MLLYRVKIFEGFMQLCNQTQQIIERVSSESSLQFCRISIKNHVALPFD